MPRIPPVTTAGLDDSNRRRRHREVTDLMLNFQHDDSRIRTPAEISAGVTPVNYAYEPGDVRRYGAVGDGTTDDTTAVQTAITLCATHVAVFQNVTYKVTDTITFPAAHALKVEGNYATFDSSAAAAAFQFTLISGTIYPQGCLFRNFNITVRGGTSRSGWIVQTSYSRYDKIFIGLASDAASAKGFVLVGDETNGTGPYYNTFVNCYVQGNDSPKTQTGVQFVAVAPTYSGPNANTWVGGRCGQCATGFTISGAGNSLLHPTVESCTTGFNFMSGVLNRCIQNQIVGHYMEDCTTGFLFDVNSTSNHVVGGFQTGGTTLWSDSGSGNARSIPGYAWINPDGIQFPTASSNADTLDAYHEGSITPALTFATPGTLSVAYGASNSGSYTRIGNRVFFSLDLDVSTVTLGTASGALRISGLPTAAVTGDDIACTLCNHSSGVTYSASRTWITPIVVGGQSYVQFYQNGSALAATDLTATNITSGGALRLQISGSYSV